MAASALRIVTEKEPVWRTLDALGLKHGTDKSSSHHDYLRWYEAQLAPMRDLPIRLLEMGVFEGASLRMWADYFRRGYITGFDIDPATEQFADGHRIRVIIGNQGVVEQLPREEQFDVIVDDAGHEPENQLSAFKNLIGCFSRGGIYFIEDVTDVLLPNFFVRLASAALYNSDDRNPWINENAHRIESVSFYRGATRISQAISIRIRNV